MYTQRATKEQVITIICITMNNIDSISSTRSYYYQYYY